MGLAEPRVRANTAPWSADEDLLLKEGIRSGLPQTGNLAATAAGLHRRLNRRPDGIMHRVNALRRLDPEFDRFIRQYVRRAADAPEEAGRPQDAQPPATSHFRSPSPAGPRRRPGDGRGRGPGRSGRPGRVGNGVPRGATPHGERRAQAPALSLVEAGASQAQAEAARKATDLLVAWLEGRLGELPEDARRRLARLVKEEGAMRVALATADAMLAATELLLDRAAETLRLWESVESQQVSGEAPRG